MRAAKRIFLLIMVLSLAQITSAQQQETAGLTDFPVPAWPANGVVGADLKDHYVFIDLSKNEYVLSYPENLGSATFDKDGPGTVRTSRYEMLRNVEPSVTVAITPVQQQYRYVYTVADAANAKQSIDQWSLAVPEQAGDDAIKHPAGWFGLTQKGRTFKVKYAWVKSGAADLWSFEKPEEVVQPGTSKTGFEIESALRPGFTVGYFRKAESVEAVVAASGNLAAPIMTILKKDIEPLLAVEYNSKTLIVIAPKFAKDADDKTVATDFLEGITALGRTGGLDPNSDFVKTATNDLKAIQAGGSAKVTAQAKTPGETQVLNALKVSLHIN